MFEYLLKCDVCGKKFYASRPYARYCSSKCRCAAKKHRDKLYAEGKLAHKPKAPTRIPKEMVDGVPVGIAARVREALALGVSYGKLQQIRAFEAAAAERKRQKMTYKARTANRVKRKPADDGGPIEERMLM